MIDKVQEFINPLNVYCRLMDLVKFMCKMYERFIWPLLNKLLQYIGRY